VAFYGAFVAGFSLGIPGHAVNVSTEIPQPVAVWNFDGSDVSGEWQDAEGKTLPGPRFPVYPLFPANNLAADFRGTTSTLVVKEQHGGDTGRLRVQRGDSLTLEAWIAPRDLPSGKSVYLVTKGGRRAAESADDDLNYGLQLRRGVGDAVQIGFEFASQSPVKGTRKRHRWWTSEAFLTGATWHHLAVTYTFGKPESAKGYFDGLPIPGSWNKDEATTEAPVADNASLTIGGRSNETPNAAYTGGLDALAIYRAYLPPTVIAKRYAMVPAPPADDSAQLLPGKVLIQICDGISPRRDWPEFHPNVAETYAENAFGLFELPQYYVATGVRGDRPNPSLVRASAMVELPPGRHRILLRARGKSRLYIDGRPLLDTPLPKGDTEGHGITAHQEQYLNLGPDFRFAPPGNRESWCVFESPGKLHLIVLETIIGGRQGDGSFRPELGETVAAWSREGEETWALLTPGKRCIAYTDEGWAAYEAERRQRLDAMNAARRAEKRSEFAGYWAQRRVAAREWLAATPEVPVPALPVGFPANNAIDHFIGARIAGVAPAYHSAKSGSVEYFRDIQPMLETKCYDCHHGGKVKGGLNLDSLANAQLGGDADGPAVVPGDPVQSALLHRVRSTDADEVMPPKGDRFTAAEAALLERWIREGASWPEFKVSTLTFTPPADDLTFLRRVTLDTVGVVPTEAEIRRFLDDRAPDRRAAVIDRLLADPRGADHGMGYWLDVLAENPNIINPTLNNSGPFRWWIYESLLDDKPMDLFVTELVRMEGSERFGGPAGFAIASQNDAPLAEKGAIISTAFLGVEMKCARCHDAPAHVSKQKNLFQLAAMLNQAPVNVPATSSVSKDKLHEGGRKPLIQVTLDPGSDVPPAWPFARFCDPGVAQKLAARPDNTRDQLAALITAPQNERFAEVMVNRVWQRLMGRGIVATVSDWEKSAPTHPELLRWMAREFIRSGYSLKSVARLIFNSHAYQRASVPELTETEPLYVAPAPRRLSAEQIVDSLFVATGKPFRVEEASLDLDSVRGLGSSITLGQPRRAWMLTSTSNERDRPSLSLPRMQAVASVLEAFGWRGARQDAVSIRESAPNVLQPAILSNGVMGSWLTRLSDDHGITALALAEQPLDQLIDRLFLRLLTRAPSTEERRSAEALLGPGYAQRIRAAGMASVPVKRVRPKYVTWSNHLDGPANLLAQEAEGRARLGDPPTARLDNGWRERLEDQLWAMLNAPEWIFAR